MTLRLTEKQDADLALIADSMGISKQRAVEIALEEYLERMDQHRLMEKAFNLVMTRDAELLRRLADS